MPTHYCDKCQWMLAKGRVRIVPLQSLPVITEPFSRVAINLVRDLSPPSVEEPLVSTIS